MITASIVMIFGLFGIYAWLCAVAAGVSLLRLLPSSSYTRHSLRLFNPRWQAVQLVLAAALATFWYFYGSGVMHRSVDRFAPTLWFTAVAIVLQAGLQLYASLRKLPTGFRFSNILYAVCCFLVLIGLGTTGIIGLTGATFWHSKVGWLLFLLVCIVTMAVAFNYIYYAVGRTPHDRLHQIARWLNVSTGVVGTVVLLALGRQNDHRLGLVLPIALAGLLIILQIVCWFTARERYMWWVLTAGIIAFPVILALANLPFVLYPTVIALTNIAMPTLGVKIVMIGVLALTIGGVARLLWPLTQTTSKR